MKFVIAFDKFKGSLSATEACEIVRRELLRVRPDARLVVKPMADGGEGTAEVLQTALGGEWIFKQVTGPLPTVRVTARYLWHPTERRAVIEMAQASGLVLIPPAQRNPLLTTTYGTGELLADAIQRGSQQIWLTVGGSATTDGGIGAAAALGWRFLDATGHPVQAVGGQLQQIARIVPPTIADSHSRVAVEVLCDVDNPLCGEHGAARVFGPQKGATLAMVEQLDAGLRHLAALVKTQLGKDILDLPGAGAAGGLAAGAVAFLNARLVPGIETVIRTSRLADELADADWVLTGEGRLDTQSLRGKVVSGVIALAKRARVKVAVLAGSVELSEAEWRSAGIEIARAIAPAMMSTAEAMKRAKELLAAAVHELFQARSQATQ